MDYFAGNSAVADFVVDKGKELTLLSFFVAAVDCFLAADHHHPHRPNSNLIIDCLVIHCYFDCYLLQSLLIGQIAQKKILILLVIPIEFELVVDLFLF